MLFNGEFVGQVLSLSLVVIKLSLVNPHAGGILNLMNSDYPQNQEPKLQIKAPHVFLLILLFAALYGVFIILKPYLNTIILAIILATVVYPFHARIEKKFKNRKNLAALTSCTILVLLVVLPLTFVLIAMIQQGIHSFSAIQTWLTDGNLDKILEKPFIENIMVKFQEYVPDFDPGQWDLNKGLMQSSGTLGRFLLDQGGSIMGNITAFVGKFFLMIFVFFFIVRDGKDILAGMLHLIPLSTSQESEIIEKIRTVSRSALMGTILTAMAQGAAGGIAFAICGLPGLFWGSMMAFASLIPMVGTALIWGPAAGYLFLSGETGFGIFLIVWSIGVVGSIDNFLRPLFMKDSAGMSTLLIFFSILGGISTFGLIGILYGPLLFGIALVLLYIYELEFAPFLKYQDKA